MTKTSRQKSYHGSSKSLSPSKTPRTAGLRPSLRPAPMLIHAKRTTYVLIVRRHSKVLSRWVVTYPGSTQNQVIITPRKWLAEKRGPKSVTSSNLPSKSTVSSTVNLWSSTASKLEDSRGILG